MPAVAVARARGRRRRRRASGRGAPWARDERRASVLKRPFPDPGDDRFDRCRRQRLAWGGRHAARVGRVLAGLGRRRRNLPHQVAGVRIARHDDGSLHVDAGLVGAEVEPGGVHPAIVSALRRGEIGHMVLRRSGVVASGYGAPRSDDRVDVVREADAARRRLLRRAAERRREDPGQDYRRTRDPERLSGRRGLTDPTDVSSKFVRMPSNLIHRRY